MIAHPITQPVQFWQFNGSDKPAWVKRCTLTVNGELLHDRQSGRQVLNHGEYLVRDLDGEIVFYTPEEFERAFEVRAR